MEFAVGALPLHDGSRFLSSHHRAFDRRQMPSAVLLAGMPKGEQLQRRPHFDHLLLVHPIHRRHANASPRLADRQALCTDKMKRLAHRHVARTEFGCNMILPQRRAGRQLAGNDPLNQRLGNALSDSGRSFGFGVHHRLSTRFAGAGGCIA